MKEEVKYETEFEGGEEIDIISAILTIETFETGTVDIIKAWSYLIGTDTIRRLQGMYQRGMANFVNNDIIDDKGVVNWEYLNELLAENAEEHD